MLRIYPIAHCSLVHNAQPLTPLPTPPRMACCFQMHTHNYPTIIINCRSSCNQQAAKVIFLEFLLAPLPFLGV